MARNDIVTDVRKQKALNAGVTTLRMSEVVIYTKQFQTEAYQRNFDGVRIDDMGELARKFRSGVPREELVRIEA